MPLNEEILSSNLNPTWGTFSEPNPIPCSFEQSNLKRFVPGISISLPFKCECYIIMQIYTILKES